MRKFKKLITIFLSCTILFTALMGCEKEPEEQPAKTETTTTEAEPQPYPVSINHTEIKAKPETPHRPYPPL